MPSLTTAIITAIEITQTGYSTKTQSSGRSIYLCFLWDACHDLLWVRDARRRGKKKSLISSHLDLMLGQ